MELKKNFSRRGPLRLCPPEKAPYPEKELSKSIDAHSPSVI